MDQQSAEYGQNWTKTANLIRRTSRQCPNFSISARHGCSPSQSLGMKGTYQPPILAPLVALTGNPVVPDHLRKGERRVLPTSPLLTVPVDTSLLTLRGVDAVEPDAFSGNLDGVAIDDTGLAGDVGHRNGRDQEQDYSEGNAQHRRMIAEESLTLAAL